MTIAAAYHNYTCAVLTCYHTDHHQQTEHSFVPDTDDALVETMVTGSNIVKLDVTAEVSRERLCQVSCDLYIMKEPALALNYNCTI